LSIEALPAELVEGPPQRRRSLRLAARNPSVLIGALIVVVLALLGLLAPLLDTLPPSEINPVFRNKKPGAERVIRDSNGAERKYAHRLVPTRSGVTSIVACSMARACRSLSASPWP
jgi:peptide/nickel transport system permease protein